MARKKSNRRGKGPVPGSAKTSVDFWGSAERLPRPQQVKATPDPYAVPRSLGRPPFAGHEAVGEHYLRAVYNHTVKLSEALAAAGKLTTDAETQPEEAPASDDPAPSNTAKSTRSASNGQSGRGRNGQPD